MKTNDQLSAKIDQISQKLDKIEQKVTINTQQIVFIKKYIEGNGQPGILTRIRNLEQFKWQIAAGLTVFVFILDILSRFVKV